MKNSVKGISKQTIKKLTKASVELDQVSELTVSGDQIILVDLYKLKNNSDDIVSVSLLFYNTGLITTTTVYLEKVIFDGLENVHGSINNHSLVSNADLYGKTIDIYSVATSTALTKLPSDFKADLILTGGKGKIAYPISNAIELKNVGDTVILNLSIFFY